MWTRVTMSRENDLHRDVATRIAGQVGLFIGTRCMGDTPSPVVDERSFARVEDRWFRRDRRRWQRPPMAWAGLAVAAAVAAALFVVVARPPAHETAPITGRMEGGPPLTIGEISAGPTREAALLFSDGTRIGWQPAARGRVVELGVRGCRIALDDGEAHVQVKPRAGAEWSFQAGPFVVKVHGTAFWLSWRAATSRFELRMESGSVTVRGPVPGGEMRLARRESFAIELGGRAAAPTSASAPHPPGAAAPVVSALAASPTGVAPRAKSEAVHRQARARASEPAGAPGVDHESWATQLDQGGAHAIVAAAHRRGLDRVLERGSSQELAALAHAARYVGDHPLARRALLAQRRRFAGSVRAAEAAFLLGRLEDGAAEAAPRAIVWYDRYLTEAPRGAYVAEALGRKMMGLERAGRRNDATAIAKDYLRRFPEGTYAHAADALLHAPAP